MDIVWIVFITMCTTIVHCIALIGTMCSVIRVYIATFIKNAHNDTYELHGLVEVTKNKVYCVMSIVTYNWFSTMYFNKYKTTQCVLPAEIHNKNCTRLG